MIFRSLILTVLTLLCLAPASFVYAETQLLEDIRFTSTATGEEHIIFQLNGAHLPKVFAIKGEKPRVVFDFLGTKSKLAKNRIDPDGRFVKAIRIGIHYKPDPKVRVVFDLQPDTAIDFEQDFNQESNTLLIKIFQAGTAVKEEKTQEKKIELKPAEEKKTAQEQDQKKFQEPEPFAVPVTKKQEAVDTAKASLPEKEGKKEATDVFHKKENEKKAEAPFLRSIEFDKSSERGEMVLFKLNDFYPPIVFGIEEGVPRVVCDFTNTTAAQDIKEINKFDGNFVKMVRVGRHSNPNKVRVVLDLAPNSNYDLQQVFFKEDNLFVLIVNTIENSNGSKKPASSETKKEKTKK